MVKKRMGVRHELFQFDRPTAGKNLGEARAGGQKVRGSGGRDFCPSGQKLLLKKGSHFVQ